VLQGVSSGALETSGHAPMVRAMSFDDTVQVEDPGAGPDLHTRNGGWPKPFKLSANGTVQFTRRVRQAEDPLPLRQPA
jgi:hypothetical protein